MIFSTLGVFSMPAGIKPFILTISVLLILAERSNGEGHQTPDLTVAETS